MKISRIYSKLEKVVIELDKREILEAVKEYINGHFNGHFNDIPRDAKWTMTWEVGDLVDELTIEATYNIEKRITVLEDKNK